MTVDFVKDPQAVLDYVFPWSVWLAEGEEITAHTVTASAGLTVDSSSVGVGGDVTVWLSGGTAGMCYSVACRITTNAGRTDERTMTILVQER